MTMWMQMSQQKLMGVLVLFATVLCGVLELFCLFSNTHTNFLSVKLGV